MTPWRREHHDDVASADLTRFTPDERVNISVYETVNRSVVHITTKTLTREMFMRSDYVPAGTGSGSVLDTSRARFDQLACGRRSKQGQRHVIQRRVIRGGTNWSRPGQ